MHESRVLPEYQELIADLGGESECMGLHLVQYHGVVENDDTRAIVVIKESVTHVVMQALEALCASLKSKTLSIRIVLLFMSTRNMMEK